MQQTTCQAAREFRHHYARLRHNSEMVALSELHLAVRARSAAVPSPCRLSLDGPGAGRQ